MPLSPSLTRCDTFGPWTHPAARRSLREALTRLRDGNRRFVAGVRGLDALISQTRRAALATEQRPFAVVLGCSDSRVPAELVFDQGHSLDKGEVDFFDGAIDAV